MIKKGLKKAEVTKWLEGELTKERESHRKTKQRLEQSRSVVMTLTKRLEEVSAPCQTPCNENWKWWQVWRWW